MAGDWIKMRKDLPTDPGVIRISAATGLDPFAVAGRLLVVWAWADTHADCHGRVTLVSRAWLDTLSQHAGFADAMASAGWLVIDADGVTFPRFERHMGANAKARAMAAGRQQRSRAARTSGGRAKPAPEAERGHAAVTPPSRPGRDETVTREEKRREEKKNTEDPPKPPFDSPAFAAAWADWQRHRAEKKAPLTPTSVSRQFKLLAGLGEAAAVAAIEESIRNGWTGLFEPKGTGPPRKGGYQSHDDRVMGQVEDALFDPD